MGAFGQPVRGTRNDRVDVKTGLAELQLGIPVGFEIMLIACS